MLSLLFVNSRAIGVALVLSVLAAAALYVFTLQSRLDAAREALTASESRSDAYQEAAQRAVEQGQELIKSRDRAAQSLRSALDRIDASDDACLSQPLPGGLLDE